MKSNLIRTLIAGVLVFIPIFFAMFLGVRTFKSLRDILSPISDKLEIDRVAGVILLNLAAAVALVLLLLLLGIIARATAISDRAEKFDQKLALIVPGYAMFRAVLGGILDDEKSVERMKPVYVKSENSGRLGFEIERTEDGEVVVFLPETPNPKSGISKVYPADRILPLDLAPHRAMEALNFYGRGTAKALSGKGQKESGKSRRPSNPS